MANTYTQIYIHIVFAVQGRQNLIKKENKEELQKYITGIIRNKNQKLIAINIPPDHGHIFIGMKPSIALSDLVRDIKNNSSTFIKEKKWMRGKFNCRRDLALFPMAIHKQTQLRDTFRIRRNIIRKRHSSRNIQKSLKNSTWNMMRNIFLNGLMMNEIEDIKHVTPTEFTLFVNCFAINISSLRDCSFGLEIRYIK